MHDLSTIIGSVNGVCLSLTDWFAYLRRRGRLEPLLREALLELLVARRAAAAGLTVTESELQAASDALRRRHGLTSAASTNAWLTRQGLKVEDFERSLEADLLARKLKDHLTRDRITDHFNRHRESYSRARLRVILVDREDLAHELQAQIRDEGREFPELARKYSRHSSRSDSGRLGMLWRRQLPSSLAGLIFAAQDGEVVGPLASPRGFHLFLVEKLIPPALDTATTAVIRQELFDHWCQEQMPAGSLQFPLLEAL